MTMLDKAGRELLKYRDSSRQDPYRFPPQLSFKDRQVLHEAAEQMGLLHSSEGDGDQRCLVISRREGAQTYCRPHYGYEHVDLG